MTPQAAKSVQLWKKALYGFHPPIDVILFCLALQIGNFLLYKFLFG